MNKLVSALALVSGLSLTPIPAQTEEIWVVGDLKRLISYEGEETGWVDTTLEEQVLRFQGTMFLLKETRDNWPLEMVLSAEVEIRGEVFIYNYNLAFNPDSRNYKHLRTTDPDAPTLMFTMYSDDKYKFSLDVGEGRLMHWNFWVYSAEDNSYLWSD